MDDGVHLTRIFHSIYVRPIQRGLTTYTLVTLPQGALLLIRYLARTQKLHTCGPESLHSPPSRFRGVNTTIQPVTTFTHVCRQSYASTLVAII